MEKVKETACIDYINGICNITAQMRKLKWYNFFKYRKLFYQREEDLGCIEGFNTFVISNALCTFLSALPQEVTTKAGIDFREAYLGFSIDTSVIDYNPLRSEFTVEDLGNSFIYTISPSVYITKKMSLLWKPLVPKIRKFYIEKIIELSELVSELGDSE